MKHDVVTGTSKYWNIGQNSSKYVSGKGEGKGKEK